MKEMTTTRKNNRNMISTTKVESRIGEKEVNRNNIRMTKLIMMMNTIRHKHRANQYIDRSKSNLKQNRIKITRSLRSKIPTKRNTKKKSHSSSSKIDLSFRSLRGNIK
jgi:hypothetical protein